MVNLPLPLTKYRCRQRFNAAEQVLPVKDPSGPEERFSGVPVHILPS